ncbi:MAG: hypothetical protein QOE70_6229 [Chthoniobacter sp.]|jgi:hypothetical protein|nr:hypothetical protein [Chthoniobacter sp.]
MTDEELKLRLRQVPVPAPADGAQERAWHRARLAFENRADPGVLAPSGRAWGFRTLVASLVLCGVIGAAFLAGHWSGQRSAVVASLDQDQRLLGELNRLFPGQLQAIICSGRETEIVTSSDQATFSRQPLVVELRQHDHRVRIVSFSGQRVIAEIDGQRQVLEFLLTSEGAILVSGETFLWQSDRPQIAGGFEIQARPLTASL